MEFSYLKPKTINEALDLKYELGEKTHFLAGGSDLLLKMKRNVISPAYIISLNAIDELKGYSDDGENITINALTSLRSIEKEDFFQEKLPVLTETTKRMASPQIRSTASIGGNICNASPAADMVPPLIALGAKVKMVGKDGEKIMQLEEFITGPGQCRLGDAELLRAIIVPKPGTASKACYLKESIRQGHDVALAGVAVMITLAKDKSKIEEARIVLGAVAPTPVRATKAEKFVKANQIDKQLIEQASLLAQEAAQPIDDIRTTAGYRKRLVKVLVARALEQLLEGSEKVEA